MFNKHQKYERTKYIRELERFLNRLVKFIDTQEFDYEKFKNFIDKILQPVENAKKVYLEKEYYKKLQELAGDMKNIHKENFEEEKIKKDIKHKANKLRKLKRLRSFDSKIKHKKNYEF